MIRTPYGTVLESRNRHDYKTHLDANGKVYVVDGGLDYLRRNVHDDAPYEELALEDDEPHEVQRRVMVWDTRGKDGKKPLEYKAIADLDTDHIEAILKTQKHIALVYKNCMEKEVEIRG